MDKLSLFNERLKELMQYKNIKSEKLADAVGVTGSVVRRWTFNDTDLKLSNLLKLADYFNCSIEFLIGRSDKVLDFSPKECPPFYDAAINALNHFDVTVYKVSKETKIKGYHFYIWKKGSEPKLSSLIELSNYLGCTIDFLLGRE